MKNIKICAIGWTSPLPGTIRKFHDHLKYQEGDEMNVEKEQVTPKEINNPTELTSKNTEYQDPYEGMPNQIVDDPVYKRIYDSLKQEQFARRVGDPKDMSTEQFMKAIADPGYQQTIASRSDKTMEKFNALYPEKVVLYDKMLKERLYKNKKGELNVSNDPAFRKIMDTDSKHTSLTYDAGLEKFYNLYPEKAMVYAKTNPDLMQAIKSVKNIQERHRMEEIEKIRQQLREMPDEETTRHFKKSTNETGYEKKNTLATENQVIEKIHNIENTFIPKEDKIVNVLRSSGKWENWEISQIDRESGIITVAKNRMTPDTLIKQISVEELADWQKVDGLSVGDTANVKRSSGKLENDWEISQINKENGTVRVVKNKRSPNFLMKIIPMEEFVKLQHKEQYVHEQVKSNNLDVKSPKPIEAKPIKGEESTGSQEKKSEKINFHVGDSVWVNQKNGISDMMKIIFIDDKTNIVQLKRGGDDYVETVTVSDLRKMQENVPDWGRSIKNNFR